MKVIYDKWWQKLPWMMLLIVIILCFYGLLILYSASYTDSSSRVLKQTIYILIFFPVSFVISFINIKYIYRFSYIFYILTIGLLIYVFLFGYTAMGATRWVDIYGIKIQPSELSKLSIILFLSYYYNNIEFSEINNLFNITIPLIIIAVPVGLTILQPDLGNGIIILLISAIMFFASGISALYFITVFIIAVCACPVLWMYLYDYQKKRILVFLDPELDPLGVGYNIIQSKISIGSGGILGKGFLRGTQSHLNFLPEHQTDFIFSLLAEELGLCGCVIFIFLLFILIFNCLLIGISCRNRFGKLVCIGIGSMIFINGFVNIAMVSGILPVVGVPLPFVSYGGTVVATMFICIGLLMNVYVNKIKSVS